MSESDLQGQQGEHTTGDPIERDRVRARSNLALLLLGSSELVQDAECDYLRGRGYNVVHAHSVPPIDEMGQYDGVVLHWGARFADHFLSQVRQREEYAYIKIVVTSAGNREQLEKELRGRGVDGIFMKGYPSSEQPPLLSLLDELLNVEQGNVKF